MKEELTVAEWLKITTLKSKLNHGAKIFMVGKIRVVAINKKNAVRKIINASPKLTDCGQFKMFFDLIQEETPMYFYCNSKNEITKSDSFEERLKKFLLKNIK